MNVNAVMEKNGTLLSHFILKSLAPRNLIGIRFVRPLTIGYEATKFLRVDGTKLGGIAAKSQFVRKYALTFSHLN